MTLACTARCSLGMRFRSVISRMENVTAGALRYSSTNITADMTHASASVRFGPLAPDKRVSALTAPAAVRYNTGERR